MHQSELWYGSRMQPENASARTDGEGTAHAKTRSEDELELLRPLIEAGCSEEEQDEFLRDLEASIEECDRGYGIDSSVVLARLRSQLKG
jgi:hypothetical protein